MSVNNLYEKSREKFSGGTEQINWISDIIKAFMLTSGYTPNFTTDQYLSDVVAGNRVSTAQTLVSKTNALGVLDAADPVFPSVTGSAVAAILLYKDTGVEATSPIICYLNGKILVTANAAALTSATSINIEPLAAALASGTTLLFGAVTATLSAPAAADDRSLTVTALSGGIAAGVTAEGATTSGLPITPNGGSITFQFDNGTYKILKL